MSAAVRPDRPGHNVELHPEAAPQWLRPALHVDPEAIHRKLGVSRHAGGPVPSKQFAVLMAVSGDSLDDAAVLLTHRSPDMRSHPGQIAFPGGRVDPGDVNVVDTALREAWEETGLDRMSVTPLAQWQALRVRSTGSPVSAVLAHWHSHSDVGVASPAETDDVFSVRLRDLADPGHRLQVGAGDWRGPAFRIYDYIIWGFTAAVLAGMLDHAGWEQKWDSEAVQDLRQTLSRSRNNEKMS